MVVCLCVLATAKIHEFFCIQIVSLQKLKLKLSVKVQIVESNFFTY